MSRSILVSSFAFALALGLGARFAAAEAPPSSSKPCTAATHPIAQVEAACKRGGQDEVKKMMKAVVDKARAAGMADMKCASCHENLKQFSLAPNAVADLKKWL